MAKSDFSPATLRLKYDPNASHCLSWSIVDEVGSGKYTLDGFRSLARLADKPEDMRRYAEILYHQNVSPGKFLGVISRTIIRLRKKRDFVRVGDLEMAFSDWRVTGAL